jgi:hypothetical protein
MNTIYDELLADWLQRRAQLDLLQRVRDGLVRLT